MSLAFIPFYIKLMGVEAYGVIGIFISLQAVFAVLDLGLSQSLGREMARLSVLPEGQIQMANTARTLEVVYASVALCVGLLVALLSHFVAFYWLNPQGISRESLRAALCVMAFVVALRWPLNLYMGGMNGLQRQISLNIILVVFATLQGVGALLVLWLISPTVHAFLAWQGLIALIQLLVLRTLFWRLLTYRNARFSMEVLRGVWSFAFGMTGIALLATLLTQIDKIILSKMLDLTTFGYYVFSASVAAVVFRFVTPVFTAYLPRFTQLVSLDDKSALVEEYHHASQIVALVVIPVSCILAVFSKEILLIWTSDPQLVDNVWVLVSVLAIGNAINGLMNIPYALQLAYGWTRFAMYINAVAVFVLGPMIYFACLKWGGVGAASVWILLNSTYVIIGIQVMHRKFLVGEMWRWYRDSLLLPLASGAAVAIILSPAHCFVRVCVCRSNGIAKNQASIFYICAKQDVK
jgi:O-antigen/teichoic acid export membrane protein